MAIRIIKIIILIVQVHTHKVNLYTTMKQLVSINEITLTR